MDNFITLLLFSVSMLVGCYLAGMVPLAMHFSESRLKYVSVMGAGLLVGTALAVIIPEGVNAVLITHTQQAALSAGVHSGPELHSMVGAALVLGFVLMLLVDYITHCADKPTTVSMDSETGVTGVSVAGWNVTATVGLVVHAAADGVALGAAVASSRADVELIVFFAIMLHKAPAAFGLVTYLMHAGLEISRIRRHLLIFSFAAPVMAILTYCCITLGGSEALAQSNATGLCLLFSAGTFVYVSTVHVLPDVLNGTGTGATSSSGVHGHGTSARFTAKQLFCLVTGCLLPLLLSFNHHH